MLGAVYEKRLSDGRYLTVYPELLGTACIAVNDARQAWRFGEGEWEEPDRDGGYDGYFQYENLEVALVAAHAMQADDKEPDSWIRAAPPRFRRRPGGDPDKEFIRP